MRLGFFTACLPRLDLDAIAAWAGDNGYAALEVAAWPRTGGRDFQASHLDVAGFDERAAESVRVLFDKHGLRLSAVGYYENNLHPDADTRAATHEHLRRCIDAAQLLGVPHVGTFVGRDPTRSVHENLREAERVMPPLVEYAAGRDIRLVIENCPMEGWHPDGYPGNLAYSPELWEWMFDLGLYLNFDPSHLLPLGIDPVAALRPYLDRVLHVQAKDAELDVTARNRYGYFGRTVERKDGWDVGWWRYRVPGLGSVDWRRVIDTLYQGHYDGAVSIEHEDPVWGGTEERVKQGLQIAQRTLSPLIVA
ncbi:MAG: sugar phosphate isomerase/epimerase [Actinomycetota bacterium]|nr:sugar phosphate isomerase/epimerase [Actinomycetota bacterium]